MKKEIILFIFIAILIIFISFIFTKSIINNISTKETKSTSKIKEEKREVIEENIIPNGKAGIVSHKYIGYGQIEVIIKNNTGKELKQLKVNAKCWDANNNNLGTYSNGKYNINTIDKYKIIIYCSKDMNKYELNIEYN